MRLRPLRIIKWHGTVLFWTVMISVEAPLPPGPYSLYAYGEGRHQEWRVSWWRSR